ncbi:hypothetical protein [Corynebacterium neomassiliense]|uniref:hypothetical protein n=1 Tax=Corynebacterium neomassiliense TaxID=2079482 RepID=UPI001F2B0E35|nr:hypothetical protein [Corynebacterium neomassiliense]
MGDGDTGAPDNWFGITDPERPESIAGVLAARRLGELEHSAPLPSFTRDDLCRVHAYLM